MVLIVESLEEYSVVEDKALVAVAFEKEIVNTTWNMDFVMVCLDKYSLSKFVSKVGLVVVDYSMVTKDSIKQTYYDKMNKTMQKGP